MAEENPTSPGWQPTVGPDGKLVAQSEGFEAPPPPEPASPTEDAPDLASLLSGSATAPATDAASPSAAVQLTKEPEDSIRDKRTFLSSSLGLPVPLLIIRKHGDVFRFQLENGAVIRIGEMKELLNFSSVQLAIAEGIDHVIPKKLSTTWDSTAQLIIDVERGMRGTWAE